MSTENNETALRAEAQRMLAEQIAINARHTAEPPGMNGHDGSGTGVTFRHQGSDQSGIGPDGLHVLDHYVPHTDQIQAIEFVFDDVLSAQVSIVAGAPGAGKSEGFVSLAPSACWLSPPGDPMRPLLRRHVVIATEDPPQVHRILAAKRRQWAANGHIVTQEQMNEWVHVVPAKALPIEAVIKVARTWADKFTATNFKVNGEPYLALPWVIVDTKSALIQMDDENSNAENSRIISMIKTGMEGLPVTLVAHLVKSDFNRKNFDPFQMSPRGGGSQMGDVHQVLAYVFDPETRDEGDRYLMLAKKRFETPIKEVVFKREVFTFDGTDVLGNTTKVLVGCSSATPNNERTLQDKAQQETRADRITEGMKNQLANLLDSELTQGRRHSRRSLEAVAEAAGIGRNLMRDAVDAMQAEGRIQEWRRPDWQSRNNKDRLYLHPADSKAPREQWGTSLEAIEQAKQAAKDAAAKGRRAGSKWRIGGEK